MGFVTPKKKRAGSWPPTATILAVLAGVVFGMLLVTSQLAARHHADAAQHDRRELPLESKGASSDEARQLERELARVKQQLQSKAQEADRLQKYVEDLRKEGGAKGASLDRHALWTPSADREKENPELAKFLKNVAINNEVMVAVCNRNYAYKGGMLDLWIEGVRRSGVKNAMVLALDDDTKRNVEAQGFPAFRMDIQIPESQKATGDNHAVSALKFRILTNFIKLGYAVLLSDVDIVVLQNPFEHLQRDSDVEAMSDGWDPQKAYGYNHVDDDEAMGWSRYSHTMRVWMFNSGFFYMRPTQASLDLLNKIIQRVESEKGWDQAIFNEVIFMPSRPGYEDPSVTRRVLDYTLFSNSKTLFKFLRKDAGAFRNHHPVIVHVNYHPDKFQRMKAVIARYVDGDMKALDPFPDGSG